MSLLPKHIALIVLLLLPVGMNAQTKVERATEFAVGSTNRLDTYLSPENYTGLDVRFISSVLRTRECNWDIQFTHEGALDYTKNKAQNANTLAGHYDFAFAMMHRWSLLDNKLKLRLGGMTDLYAGFAYCMRNSANNPAQGYASLSIGGAGMAQYDLSLKWFKRPVILTYEARLPLIGAMFSPNYGQSYYEIFNRGDYDSNIVLNTIATPSYRHQFSIDIPVGKRSAVRVGYLGDIRQATPNNLKQHIYTHAGVIGWNTTF